MAVGYKSFPAEADASSGAVHDQGAHFTESPFSSSRISTVIQILVGYLLIIAAIWTASGVIQAIWMLSATVAICLFVFRGNRKLADLGLRAPTRFATFQILVVTTMAAVMIFAAALLIGQTIPATPHWPSTAAMVEYLPWAYLQEFILQSFFFLSMESIVGGKRAVWLAALLFALAHIPNPILTIATFLGALFFCEMFRRHRSLLPMGLAHAALGIALAFCVPTPWIHHMRVGIGYLRFT